MDNKLIIEELEVAVLIPCHNEGAAIANVVKEFSSELPKARIYVYDNNSIDDTIAQARTAGAIINLECHQGKGHVVRRMFADIEADIYILVDGDGTYDPSAVKHMMSTLIDNELDMVIGARISSTNADIFRPGHHWGNQLISKVVSRLFRQNFSDILSGYRVMSYRFVKSFPGLSKGFEIETQLSVHAMELHAPSRECKCHYRPRVEGTESKLSTFKDGSRILISILMLYKQAHPFRLFTFISGILIVISLVAGIPVIIEFYYTGLVPRFPTAILATGLMVLAAISLTAGVILDSVARGFRELKRLHYQSYQRNKSI